VGVDDTDPSPISTPPVEEPYAGPASSTLPAVLPKTVIPVPDVPKLDWPEPSAEAVNELPLAESSDIVEPACTANVDELISRYFVEPPLF